MESIFFTSANYSQRVHFWLCSTDVRFKCEVLATEEMPFDKFADDPRFIFSRDGDEWVQQCRDPRIQTFM